MTQDSGAPRPLSPVIAGTTNNKDRTLLIADDDAAFRNRIARALEQRGFIVTAVGSVAEALAQTGSGDAYARGHLTFFLALTQVSTVFCLMTMRAAAMRVAVLDQISQLHAAVGQC